MTDDFDEMVALLEQLPPDRRRVLIELLREWVKAPMLTSEATLRVMVDRLEQGEDDLHGLLDQIERLRAPRCDFPDHLECMVDLAALLKERGRS